MTDKHGWTPFHLPASQGHEEVVRVILGHMETEGVSAGSVDPNLRDDHLGETPLHLAALEGHDRTVKLLLQNGAEANLKRNDGNTPLHLAAYRRRARTVKVLLELGNADRTAKNSKNETAFSFAFKRRGAATVQQFLKRPSRIELEEIKDCDDKVMLWAARQKETHELVRLLLKERKIKLQNSIEAELDKLVNRGNWTALHWAVYHGENAVVWWLLRSS
ncbi:ankyrin repeat-containing domain protein [Thermoascus aurantiacus ATCC 26904]